LKTAVITGASSGLGEAISNHLLKNGWRVIDWSLKHHIDVSSSFSIGQARLDLLKRGLDKIDVLINCAGINRINFLPNVPEQEWDDVMDTNAKGIFLCTKALLEELRDGTVVNIVSNASHVPMTSSAAYNASKGAAAILTKQLARELKKTHNITVFSVSPNKMSGTHMSAEIDRRVVQLRGWTEQQAREYQLAALPAGEETPPAIIAEFIAFLLSSKERHKYLAGCDIPYGGP